MKHKILALIAVSILGIGSAAAQYNETNNLFYHSFRVPQSNQLNAAFFPNKNSFFLTLPSFGTRFGSTLAIKDFIYYDAASQQTIISIDSILTGLTNNNRFRFGVDMDIIGLGLRVGNTFVTFNTRLVNDFSFGIPIDMVNALLVGNVDQNGNVINEVTLLDGDLLNLQSYMEVGLGVGHRFPTIGLTAGARIKMLSGIVSMQTDNSRIVLNTDDDLGRITADVYYQLQASTAMGLDSNMMLSKIGFDEIVSAFGANTGLAFDIGAKYDLGPFSFSLALNDLTGGIHWKKNIYTVAPEGGHAVWSFDGENIRTILDNGEMNTDSLTASLQQFLNGLKPDTTTGGDYWFSVPTKLNIGASYSFAKLLRAGLLLHGQWDRGLMSRSNKYELDLTGDLKNTFRFNTTLSFGVNLFNWAEVIVGSSIVYDGQKINPFNPGVGLIFTPATAVQFYMMADYVSSIYLVEAKAFNVKFGFNLLFGMGSGAQIVEN